MLKQKYKKNFPVDDTMFDASLFLIEEMLLRFGDPFIRIEGSTKATVRSWLSTSEYPTGLNFQTASLVIFAELSVLDRALDGSSSHSESTISLGNISISIFGRALEG